MPIKPTFAMFQSVLTPSKPKPSETARQSFTFEQFLRIEICSEIWMSI